jgi:DNA-binding CsgD family transcriptional regulator
MSTDDYSSLAHQDVNVFETDERYHFKLSAILRKRRKPLLIVFDQSGELLSCSVSDDAPPYEHRLLDQALAEARALLDNNRRDANPRPQLVVARPGERCALVLLENEFYSLKVFPLHGPIDDVSGEKYAALAEPVVKPLAEGVDFKSVGEKWHLSPRELDVVKALMNGDTDKEIARELQVSVETVRAYLKSIRAKLGVSTRTAIVHLAHMMSSGAHRDDIHAEN